MEFLRMKYASERFELTLFSLITRIEQTAELLTSAESLSKIT